MLNFSVGPVQMSDEVLSFGSEQIPYFRTPEFSLCMKENERLMLSFSGATEGSRAVFLTGSGTAGMEAAVMNILSSADKVLVVNGGGFGERFSELCALHGIERDELVLQAGCSLTEQDLAPFEKRGYSALLVNHCETSTGVLYDLEMIGSFCKRNDMLLIVDAISSFLVEDSDMGRFGIDALIVGSQKALACPPGISVLVLGPRALERIEANDPRCLYFDLKKALQNAERGQTPFTPAVGTLLQINARLKSIERCGLEEEMKRARDIAEDFRRRISHLPFSLFADAPSHSVTALEVQEGVSTRLIFETLKNEFGIWICPNGGELGKRIFRVGHIGALTGEDNARLVAAFDALLVRGLLGTGDFDA